MNEKTILRAIKILILAVPLIFARDLLRDLARDFVRTRALASDLSTAREINRELSSIRDIAYESEKFEEGDNDNG
jgi:hypothetical protein